MTDDPLDRPQQIRVRFRREVPVRLGSRPNRRVALLLLLAGAILGLLAYFAYREARFWYGVRKSDVYRSRRNAETDWRRPPYRIDYPAEMKRIGVETPESSR